MAFALATGVGSARAPAPARAPRAAARATPRPAPRGAALVPAAGLRMYPEPDFVEETLASFPEKMIADAEEARVRVYGEEESRGAGADWRASVGDFRWPSAGV